MFYKLHSGKVLFDTAVIGELRNQRQNRKCNKSKSKVGVNFPEFLEPEIQILSVFEVKSQYIGDWVEVL